MLGIQISLLYVSFLGFVFSCQELEASSDKVSINGQLQTLFYKTLYCVGADEFVLNDVTYNILNPVTVWALDKDMDYTVTEYYTKYACDCWLDAARCGVHCPTTAGARCFGGVKPHALTCPEDEQSNWCYSIIPKETLKYAAYSFRHLNTFSSTSYQSPLSRNPPPRATQSIITRKDSLRSVDLNPKQKLVENMYLSEWSTDKRDPLTFMLATHLKRFVLKTQFPYFSQFPDAVTNIDQVNRNCDKSPASKTYLYLERPSPTMDLDFIMYYSTDPADKTYTTKDLLDGQVWVYTAAGLLLYDPQFFIPMVDPCNMIHYHLEIKDNQLSIVTPADFNGETVCLLVQEDIYTKVELQLLELAPSQDAFVPSKKWKGAISIDYVSDETLHLISASEYVVNETQILMEASFSNEKNTTFFVNVSTPNTTTCTFQFSPNLTRIFKFDDADHQYKIEVTKFLPLYPKVLYSCEKGASGTFLVPTNFQFLSGDLNFTAQNVTIIDNSDPGIDLGLDWNDIKKNWLGNLFHFNDWSVGAWVHRLVVVVATITILAIIIYICFKCKKCRKRGSRHEHSNHPGTINLNIMMTQPPKSQQGNDEGHPRRRNKRYEEVGRGARDANGTSLIY